MQKLYFDQMKPAVSDEQLAHLREKYRMRRKQQPRRCGSEEWRASR
jgi:hypothetical protein